MYRGHSCEQKTVPIPSPIDLTVYRERKLLISQSPAGIWQWECLNDMDFTQSEES